MKSRSNLTAAQRIYIYLKQNGRATSIELSQPNVGGLRFGARIDELRRCGVPISWQYLERDGKKTNTTIYKLGVMGYWEKQVEKKVFNG